jgi:phage terminase small subunit
MATTRNIEPETGGKADLRVVDGGKGQGKLTSKQFAFVQAILKGANQSDAYREAYNAENMSDQAIWTEAGRLFRHPEVSRRITAGRAAQERQAVHSGASLRADLISKLKVLTDSKESDAVKIRAIEVLGKTELVSLFLDRSTDVPSDNLTDDEVLEQIEKKMKELFTVPA